jgi:HAD superfamily hydrolase (TIGR01509 family)
MQIKGAIFDMDGTLVNSLMWWDVFWSNLGKKYLNNPHFKPSEDDDRKVRTMVFSDCMEYIQKTYSIPASPQEILDYAHEDIERFYVEDVDCKDGVIELLENLKSKGIKLCVASATRLDHVMLCLDNLKLTKYFEAVLSCADIGKGKDKPDIYLLALEKLGVKAEEACVFEDSYVALETAKKIGCKTVGIFDKYNFGQDRLKEASIYYVGDNQSLSTLCNKVEKV